MSHGTGFDLRETYVHLRDGPDTPLLEGGDEFWKTIATRTDLEDGRLVCLFEFDADWKSWEMHPEGDEVVFLLSGSVDVVLEEPEGERVVALRGRSACIVPRGVWHTARGPEPSTAPHIPGGAGTTHRPA